MQLTGSVVVLACQNIETMLAFYQQALQFVVVRQRKSEHGPEWVYLRSGEVSLMLEAAHAGASGDGGAGRLYLFTDDVKSLHHFLGARGYELTELKTTPYAMEEFDMQDPEGHCLTIGQRITERIPEK